MRGGFGSRRVNGSGGEEEEGEEKEEEEEDEGQLMKFIYKMVKIG